MTLAIFDLDNTLLNGDSDHAWGEFLVDQGVVDGENYRRMNNEFHEAYLAGRLAIEDYLAFALRPLAETPLDRLVSLRRRFMETVIEPMITTEAEELVDIHREKAHTLLIVTATNRFVTEPIAQRLGIDHLIATEPEFRNGCYTGHVTGTPSFREGKIARVKDWLSHRSDSLSSAWFYSDSHNDLPLLEQVPNPVAVNPDAELERIAGSREWPILRLHHADQ